VYMQTLEHMQAHEVQKRDHVFSPSDY